ncbi:MAG: Gfo/Idh/MocA family oxidoreductase [Nanoarchaeota archaeon]|nr:Gfo/Idh/MocA family oxidoreductase [Nanoarchaeota archaeon]
MLNVAVIGLGNMGKHHVRTYSEINKVKLVAVCDEDEERGKEVAIKYGCKFFKDYNEMFENEEIDLVSVVVPTKFHKDVALNVIERGINILIEKPIADTIESANIIINKSKEKNIKLAIGHIERFNPAVKRLKEIINEGRLGQITSIIARRVGLFPPQIKDANVVIDLAVHDIDIMNYLMEMQPSEIEANAGKALINQREDHAEIFLKYKNATGFIQVNWITPIKIRTLSVTGTKGYAEMDYISQQLIMYESNYKKDLETFGDVVMFSKPNKVEIGVENGEPLKLELLNVIDSIEQNREPLITGEVGLEALKIAMKVLGKIKKN